MKPKCKICEREDKSLTSILGKEIVDELVYGLFNPESLPSQEEQKIDIETLIQNHLDEIEESEEKSNEHYVISLTNHYLENYYKKCIRLKKAKEKAWKEIVEKIRRGELKPSNLPLKQLIEKLIEILTEELRKENLIELIYERHLHKDLHERHYTFTPESQKIIAQKVLEEAFIHLERYGVGLHEMNEAGIGIYPSYIIR
ncbi:MAG: hypothetical protein H3Z52_13040, partial [archaeon]|nr:hypothetical protein [archaeon]